MAPIPYPHPFLDPNRPVPVELASAPVNTIIALAGIFGILLVLVLGILRVDLPGRSLYSDYTKVYPRYTDATRNQYQNQNGIEQLDLATTIVLPDGYLQDKSDQQHHVSDYSRPWAHILNHPTHAEENGTSHEKAQPQDTYQWNARHVVPRSFQNIPASSGANRSNGQLAASRSVRPYLGDLGFDNALGSPKMLDGLFNINSGLRHGLPSPRRH